MKATDIKIERLKNPVGVDFQRPEISWVCDGGIRQSAYRVVASREGKIVWDSGRVESSDMRVSYAPHLTSRERIDLALTLWDEDGVAGEVSCAFFEMGLLEKKDFKAQWITGNYKVDKRKRYPAD